MTVSAAAWDDGAVLLEHWLKQRGTVLGPYQPGSYLSQWAQAIRREGVTDDQRAWLADRGWLFNEAEADLQQGLRLHGEPELSGWLREYAWAWTRCWHAVYELGELSQLNARRLLLPGLPDGQYLAQLDRWTRETQSSRVPAAYRQLTGWSETSGNLSKWVAQQRKAYAEDRLSSVLRDALESVEHWSWTNNTPTVNRSSFAERELRWRLNRTFVQRVEPLVVKLEGKRYELDMAVQDLKLAVEYDGWYWHDEVEDEQRNQVLERDGWTVLRVREQPRLKLREHDLLVEQEHSLETTTELVAAQLERWGCTRGRELSRPLDRVNGRYSTSTDEWYIGYERLLEWVEQHGTANALSSARTEDGYRLGDWCNTQRTSYRDQRLSSTKVKLLEQLPEWRWSKYRRLASNVEQVRAWIAEHGAAPSGRDRTADGWKIGEWATRQRSRRLRGEISKELDQELAAIEGWIW